MPGTWRWRAESYPYKTTHSYCFLRCMHISPTTAVAIYPRISREGNKNRPAELAFNPFTLSMFCRVEMVPGLSHAKTLVFRSQQSYPMNYTIGRLSSLSGHPAEFSSCLLHTHPSHPTRLLTANKPQIGRGRFSMHPELQNGVELNLRVEVIMEEVWRPWG